jgi:hypothetical protein
MSRALGGASEHPVCWKKKWSGGRILFIIWIGLLYMIYINYIMMFMHICIFICITESVEWLWLAGPEPGMKN